MSKKILFALAFCVALTACGKQEEAPAAEAVAPAAEATEAAPAEAAASELPQSCTDYIARAEACFAKAAPQAVEMLRASLEGAVEEWNSLEDKSGLDEACKAVNAEFSELVTALNCE